MPLRSIDTRFSRVLQRRHASSRPGGSLANDRDHVAADEPELDRPFDDWPFDYEPSDPPVDGARR